MKDFNNPIHLQLSEIVGTKIDIVESKKSKEKITHVFIQYQKNK